MQKRNTLRNNLTNIELEFVVYIQSLMVLYDHEVKMVYLYHSNTGNELHICNYPCVSAKVKAIVFPFKPEQIEKYKDIYENLKLYQGFTTIYSELPPCEVGCQPIVKQEYQHVYDEYLKLKEQEAGDLKIRQQELHEELEILENKYGVTLEEPKLKSKFKSNPTWYTRQIFYYGTGNLLIRVNEDLEKLIENC